MMAAGLDKNCVSAAKDTDDNSCGAGMHGFMGIGNNSRNNANADVNAGMDLLIPSRRLSAT